MNAWIGVDLDGTLAEYHGWMGPKHIGDPIESMILRVQRWLADGIEVKIFTARVSDPDEAIIALPVIRDWCQRNIGFTLEVTCCKDFGMIFLYDDRCVQVEKNTGVLMGPDLQMTP